MTIEQIKLIVDKYYKPLTREQEIKNIRKAKNNDAKAISTLLYSNLPSLLYHVLKYDYCNIDADDLFQEACIGFIQAIHKFDETKGTRLYTISYRYVQNRITDHIRENNAVYVPNTISKKDLSKHKTFSISKILNDTENMTYEDIKAQEFHPTPEEEMEKSDNIKIANDILNKLTTEEKDIIQMRFGINCYQQTIYTIADKYNKTVNQMNYDIKKILEKLKTFSNLF